MSLKDMIAADVAAVFLNTADFAESLYYYTVGAVQPATITGVVSEKGMSIQDQGSHLSEYESVKVFASRDDTNGMPTPQLQDAILFPSDADQRKWDFHAIIDSDEVSATVMFKRKKIARAGQTLPARK